MILTAPAGYPGRLQQEFVETLRAGRAIMLPAEYCTVAAHALG